MSPRTSNDQDCERFDALAIREAEGRRISPEDRRFRGEHLAACERCRLEAGAAELMLFDGSHGAAEPLDELSTRRWAEDIVDAAGAGRGADRAAGPATGGRRAIAVVAGAAALLLIGTALVLGYPDSRQDDDRGEAIAPARLVLASGEVKAGNESSGAGSALRPGEELATGSGPAVVRLAEGVAVRLAPRSRLSLLSLAPAIEVFLHQGALVASVSPRDVPRPFSVRTAAGRVGVRGTVFEVIAGASRVELKVLRGRVSVQREGAAERIVFGNQVTVLREAEVRPLSGEERAALREAAQPLELFLPERPATVSIGSRPEGAVASIDGVALGRTPLSVSLDAGERRLELALNGYGPRHETLRLGAGDSIRRSYALDPLAKETAVARPAPAPAAGAARTPQHAGAPDPGVAAEILLGQASALRAAGDWQAAAGRYEELIRGFPEGAMAGVARVNLGTLKLDALGAPAAALAIFDEYLRREPRGVLAQEAAYGRVRALRRLGRRAEERTALERFLEDYPGSVEAAAARVRLEAMRVEVGR